MAVTELVRGGTTFHIVGTAHVSQRSVDEVRDVIARVAPDAVCVELDQVRHDALTRANAFRDLDVIKVVREGRTLYLLAHLGLAAYQRRIGARLGVKPGAELLAAVEAARAAGVAVELIDRDINITLKRTWRNLGLWRRMTLLAALVTGGGDAAADGAKGEPAAAKTPEQMIEGLKEPQALSELLAELGRQVPEIKAPLIDERDQYLASKLIEAGAGRRQVVAVVGAAHVPGMLVQLGAGPPAAGAPIAIPAVAPVDSVDRAALDRVPPTALIWRILKWVVPILFIGALIWGWRRSDTVTFAQMMLAWILPTAIASGGLTLLAGGSLLAVATALVVSPIAAIHPLLGTGMVVGMVEAWRRRPSVADCERLPDDLQTWRGFRSNPVTRILVIAVASGLGTAVGFWVGVGWVATLL